LRILLRGEIGQRDVDLGRATVRHRERERHRPSDVRLLRRIVGDRPLTPRVGDLRISVDPELRPTSFHHAKEPIVVVIAGRNQIAETIGAVRRPVAVHVDDDRPFGGVEPHAEVSRRG
jgi:hypothetical protein